MSFECPDCHNDACDGFELRSYGRCESCGKVDVTYDCHYISPEKHLDIAVKMRELGFKPDPMRPGKWIES